MAAGDPDRNEVRCAAGPALVGRSLFELARRAGLLVPSSCGGKGRCRECVVEVTESRGSLSGPEAVEEGLQEGFRLACRARIEGEGGEVAFRLPSRGRLRIVPGGEDVSRPLDPCPAVLRRGGDAVRCGEVLGAAPSRLLGLAVDLGTTSVALQLCDLESGNLLAQGAFENPQRFAGSDVMARIAFDVHDRTRLLQRSLCGALVRAIEALPCEPHEILEVVVVGNPTLRDLFFGLDVRSIGEAPYRSRTELDLEAGRRSTTRLERRARSLGLPLHKGARVVGLPLIGGHLGADAAAALLASGIGDGEEVGCLMDLGTNTELVLGHRDRLLAASCPAGPAFEGGGIRWGMPALEGAIEGVRMRADKSFELEVIGGGAPRGICGSGLVALVAELLRHGRMNAVGRWVDERDADGVVLDPERGIALHEADVSELAQAKGANAAGLALLARRFPVAPEAIRRFVLAGGFGRHLDAGAARILGLVPNLPDERIEQVGNAALEGARRALCSLAEREHLERLVRRVEHVSLESDPDFFDAFVEGCTFGPFGSG